MADEAKVSSGITSPELVREWLELQGPTSRAGAALVVPARLPVGRSKKHFRDTRPSAAGPARSSLRWQRARGHDSRQAGTVKDD
jgi:hypothetical protein